MSSQSSRGPSFTSRYAGALIGAAIVSVISFIAITSTGQYIDATSRISNGVGAGLSFGGIAFLIGYTISKLLNRRPSDAVDMSDYSTVAPSGNAAGSGADDDARDEARGPAAWDDRFSLRLDQLDRSVRDAALPHWPHGNYVSAIRDAATAAFAVLQRRTGLYNMTETDLINHVFSDKPKAVGEIRLRIPHEQRSRTQRSRESGVKNLGLACFQGVRNIAAHEHKLDWGREESFEYLVMFSIFVRWIRDCEVEQ